MKEITRTKYVLFLALVVVLLTGLVGVVHAAGAGLTVSWLRTYDEVGLDRAYGAAVDSADNIIVTGEINNYQDFGTVKYDPDGNILWIKTYDSTNQDVARDVVVDSQDNIIVSGIVMGPTAGQFDRNHTVIKYAPDGSVIWLREHNSLSPTYYSSHLAVDTLDNIISTRSIEITKYNSSGTIIWDRNTWIGPWGQYMNIFNVATDSNDDILVTGAIYLNNGPNWYVATAKYRGSDGALLWYVYDPATQSSDRSSIAWGVTVDSLNNVIITGYMPGGDYLTKKYDTNGVHLWTVIDSTGYRASGVAVDFSNNIFVTGWEGYTVKYAPDGSLLWSDQFTGLNPYPVEEYYGQDIALDSSENVIVAGWYKSTQYPYNEGFFTLQYTMDVNQAPVADDQSVTTAEDTSAAIILTATDVDGDPLTYNIVGGPAHGTLSGTAPNLTYTPNLNYFGLDTFSFTANDGTADSNVATVTVNVDPVNDAPVADDQSVMTDEDTSVAITLTATDVDGGLMVFSIVDGPATGSLSGAPPNLIYTPNLNHNGSDSFTFMANDGAMDSNIATVTINVKPVNDAPVADDQSVTTNEDTPVDITVTGSDIDGDMLSFDVVDPPSHGVLEGTIPNLTYTPDLNFFGSDSFTFQACDAGGLCGLATVTVEVSQVNQPPTVDAGGPYSVVEDDSIEVSATGHDPENGPLTYEWDLDNDGVFEAIGQTAMFSASGLDGPGTATIHVQVTDNGGLTVTAQTTVDVLNAAPTVGEVTAPIDPVQVNTTVNTTADFTDPGTLDIHTATWDWGDTSTSAGAITEAGGSGSVTGSHTYATPGVYTVTLTVTDDDGGSDTEIFQYVVIYDPNGGFVTGGGWINSPEGAYTPDPSLTGKATFGFVSKYQKGANAPNGNTEFQFKVADMNFKSTSYDWLVIAGTKAMYKGTGTINGSGEYKFMLSAIDGSPDKFRIKIWDKATGEVIYDNQLGEIDTADPTTEIQGGSIVIHKAK